MSKNESSIRKVLLTGSAVFGLSALALVATPQLFNELLGLVSNPALEWSMRMTGITLVALSGNMFAHARKGSSEAVILAARVMMFSAFALGVLTLILPATLNWFTVLYAAVGFSFSAAYGYLLYQKK